MKVNTKEINNRKVIVLILALTIIVTSCNRDFKANKMVSEKQRSGAIYEVYLVKNLPYISQKKDSILLSFVRQRLKEIYKIDTITNKFGFAFYEDCSCTRNYYANYESLKGNEHIIERCEEEFWGSYSYKKSKENSNLWFLTYPENIKDTILIEK